MIYYCTRYCLVVKSSSDMFPFYLYSTVDIYEMVGQEFWWHILVGLAGLVGWFGSPENPPWPPRSLYTLLITCLIGPHMYATKTDRLKAFLLKAFILALFCLSCRSGQSHHENSVKIGQQLVQNPPPRPPSPRGAVAVVLINMIANWLPSNCRPIARIAGVAAEICQNFCRSQCIASSDIANAMTLNWYLLVPFPSNTDSLALLLRSLMRQI